MSEDNALEVKTPKTIEVDVTLKFKVVETGGWPPCESEVEVIAIGADGQEWKSGIRYDGTTQGDCLRTICRMDRLPKAISAMVMAASPIPSISAKDDDRTGFDIPENSSAGITDFSDLAKTAAKQDPPATEGGADKEAAAEKRRQARFAQQREDFYKSLHKDIQGWKYGRVRQFCTENGLLTKVPNGANLVDIADAICKELREREDKVKNNETDQ